MALSDGRCLSGASLFFLPKLSEKVQVWQYALGGVALWYCLLRAGINADIAGVVAAFAIGTVHSISVSTRLGTADCGPEATAQRSPRGEHPPCISPQRPTRSR